jgi:hypothetical protein
MAAKNVVQRKIVLSVRCGPIRSRSIGYLSVYPVDKDRTIHDTNIEASSLFASAWFILEMAFVTQDW